MNLWQKNIPVMQLVEGNLFESGNQPQLHLPPPLAFSLIQAAWKQSATVEQLLTNILHGRYLLKFIKICGPDGIFPKCRYNILYNSLKSRPNCMQAILNGQHQADGSLPCPQNYPPLLLDFMTSLILLLFILELDFQLLLDLGPCSFILAFLILNLAFW